MLILLHGPDTFRSRRKLREIEEEYRRKHGVNLNLHWFDSQVHASQECANVLDAGSLFSGKKLVIVESACVYWSEKELARVSGASRVASDVVVVFWEGSSKDSQTLVRNIQSFIDKTYEFQILSGERLRKWIREEAGVRNVAVSPQEILHLARSGGDNLWRIAQELEKKAVGYEMAGGFAQEHKIFELGDLFFVHPQRALEKLLQLIREEDISDFDIFSYLANHCRTLLLVKEYAEKREPVPSEFGVHPFVLKKAGALVRQIPLQDLRIKLRTFFEEDWKIKTGLKKPVEALLAMLV